MAKVAFKLRMDLRAIVYQEEGIWLAHCLELDIVAEGKNGNEAVSSLVSLCELQIETAVEEGNLESIFRPAPPEIWKLFAIGEDAPAASVGRKGRSRSHASGKASIDRFEARQMTFA